MTTRRAAALGAVLFAILVLLSVLASPIGAEEPRVFRIGYLRLETTGLPGVAQLEAFRAHVMADGAARAALEEAGYTSIGLYATDGSADMVRRLNSREFDLAFVPALIQARQAGDYAVVAKSRKPGDFSSPGGTVLRRGVVIASPRSALFSNTDAPGEALRSELRRARLAVVATQSVAGFHSPLLELKSQFAVELPGAGYLWFESSEEVVKAVVSGLADVGACEEAAIDSVLAAAGVADRREELLRVVHTTTPTPTDPVVIRRDLSPSRSALGRTVAASLSDFSFAGGFGSVQFVPGRDSDYDRMKAMLREFDAVVGEVGR